MILEIWREMSHDLMPLMRHIVRVVRLLAARRAPDDVTTLLPVRLIRSIPH
jgi:hypothetical protein